VKRLASGSAVGCLSYKKTGHQPTSIDEYGQPLRSRCGINMHRSANNETTAQSLPLADWAVVPL